MTTVPSPPPRRGSRGPAPTARANIRDVARLAGVSATTASRVFADSPAVRPATRQRVLEAAEELGYVVNGLAQAMMGLGRRSVAFVTARMVGPTFAAMAAGAESVATANGNLFMISTTGDDPDRERSLLETLREQRAAAVLLAGSTPTGAAFEERIAGYARDLETIGAQLVLCGHPPLADAPNILSVNYEQVEPVRRVVSLLAAAGHTKIAFLGAAPGYSTAIQREEGYLQGLADGGLSRDAAIVVSVENEAGPAELAALALLRDSAAPTAIVALTDVVAVGVYRAARRLGVDIPGQVAVVGFDDTPFVADLTPSLTTVRAPFWDVGAYGARLALGLDGARPGTTLASELILRGSAP